jgi:hypothetical protein
VSILSTWLLGSGFPGIRNNEPASGRPEGLRYARLCPICLLTLSIAVSGCRPGSTVPVELRQRFDASDAAPVEVRAIVQAEHARNGPRYLRAAGESLKTLTAWLGPYPDTLLTIVDPPWHSDVVAGPSAVTLSRTPWWSSSTAMGPELATARAIARRRWTGAVNTAALPPWFVDGLVEYSARRVVTPLFQLDNLQPGFAMLEQRYFGAFVPRFIRIRLLPEADGDPLPAYRASPRADVSAPESREEERSLAAKTVLTLYTIERWVSRPVFDGVLAEFARSSRGERPTINDFAHVSSSVSGQDLSWLFVQTLAGSAIFDYAIDGLTSVRRPEGGFDTTVVVSRAGDGIFSGSTAPRIGAFESGSGVAILITFEDGERAIERWDGRDVRKTLGYRGPSRAVSAIVDPDHTLVLDVNRTNNSKALNPRTGTSATRSAARWLMWLENVLLTYGFFV